MHIGPIPQNPIDELEKNRRTAESKQNTPRDSVQAHSDPEAEGLTKQERKHLKRQRKKDKEAGLKRKKQMKVYLGRALIALFIAVGIGGLVYFFTSQKKLPPTTMHPHIEESPSAHILTSPIPENIQKHMLEHADGDEAKGPGIFIQYNCDQYDCESDLIEKLTEVAKAYPRNVYLAPNNYDGKIILTRLNTTEILDDFDEQKIRDFIKQ